MFICLQVALAASLPNIKARGAPVRGGSQAVSKTQRQVGRDVLVPGASFVPKMSLAEAGWHRGASTAMSKATCPEERTGILSRAHRWTPSIVQHTGLWHRTDLRAPLQQTVKSCPLGVDLGTGDRQVFSESLTQRPQSLPSRGLVEAAACGTCSTLIHCPGSQGGSRPSQGRRLAWALMGEEVEECECTLVLFRRAR